MLTTRLVTATSAWLDRRVSRRGFLGRAAVVGSAVAVSGLDYVLRPGTAYASVCGSGASCSSGWTAMCCTVNSGVNRCPPGSFAGGWWKADGASLCGGKARYYIDCQGRCTGCGCSSGHHFCPSDCWNCRSHCASGTCDERRVCTNVFRYGQCHREIACSGPVWCRAISCTPPWTWESCSTASATDDNTRSHSAPCLTDGWTAIAQRYTAMGSQGSVLGATVGGERDGAVGRWQRYEHGRMYWSRDTGAHWLTGAVSAKYDDMGQSGSALGLPTDDAHATFDGEGRCALFQHGSIYAAPGARAHAVWGPVHHKWTETGWAAGVLGYPTSDLRTAYDGEGHYALYQNGAIYQGPGLAPHALYGPVFERWKADGWASGVLGYPRSDIRTAYDGEGTFALFEHGAVYQGPGLDAHGVWGPIYRAWADDGYASSRHGYPITDVQDVDGGQRCEFEHDIATYDAATGVVTFTPR